MGRLKRKRTKFDPCNLCNGDGALLDWAHHCLIECPNGCKPKPEFAPKPIDGEPKP